MNVKHRDIFRFLLLNTIYSGQKDRKKSEVTKGATRIMDDQIKDNLLEYLENHTHLRLATVTEDGSPIAHTVAYVSEGAVVYFVTDRRTRKYANITKEPRVAYTVDEDYEDWSKIQGIQMEGEASILEGPEQIGPVMAMFMKKFPKMASLPPGFEMGVVKIEPKQAYFLNNLVSFGHRDEISF